MITHVVVGPARHGVVRFGRDLHQAMVAAGAPSVLHHCADADELAGWTLGSGIHLQFTDRVFGRTPEDAAAAVAAVVADARRAGVRVTATLHDLPQPSDGSNHCRRAAAYADVCARVHAVVVSSEHERTLLDDMGGDAPLLTAVVPLPIDVVERSNPPATQSLSIGIFGFVYPGKGHLEVLAALADVAEDLEMVALGEASQGHDDLVAALHEQAAASGVQFRLTGHVPDAAVAQTLRSVTVPIAPHRHVSASGSINSWLAAGRRPLAPANRYTGEMLARNPDALELYPDTEAGLRATLKRAIDEPERTWLPASAVLTPTAAEAAAQYAELLATWHS